jgi:hypothetical protein
VVSLDTAGNKDPNPPTFGWTVSAPTPAQAIQQLIQLKHSMHLDATTNRTLDIRLNIALQFAQNNIKSGTCLQLIVFIKEVQGALRLCQVTSAPASQLIQAAENIQTAFTMCSSLIWKWNSSILTIAISRIISQLHYCYKGPNISIVVTTQVSVPTNLSIHSKFLNHNPHH